MVGIGDDYAAVVMFLVDFEERMTQTLAPSERRILCRRMMFALKAHPYLRAAFRRETVWNMSVDRQPGPAGTERQSATRRTAT